MMNLKHFKKLFKLGKYNSFGTNKEEFKLRTEPKQFLFFNFILLYNHVMKYSS